MVGDANNLPNPNIEVYAVLVALVGLVLAHLLFEQFYFADDFVAVWGLDLEEVQDERLVVLPIRQKLVEEVLDVPNCRDILPEVNLRMQFENRRCLIKPLEFLESHVQMPDGLLPIINLQLQPLRIQQSHINGQPLKPLHTPLHGPELKQRVLTLQSLLKIIKLKQGIIFEFLNLLPLEEQTIDTEGHGIQKQYATDDHLHQQIPVILRLMALDEGHDLHGHSGGGDHGQVDPVHAVQRGVGFLLSDLVAHHEDLEDQHARV
jgi:hypothetical protein